MYILTYKEYRKFWDEHFTGDRKPAPYTYSKVFQDYQELEDFVERHSDYTYDNWRIGVVNIWKYGSVIVELNKTK